MATIYDVRCPRCDKRAAAEMVATGAGSHHREVVRGNRAGRITCTHCGLARELGPEQGDAYELWYRARLGEHTVWASSRRHLDFLVGWLTGTVEERHLPHEDAAIIEALPSWLKARRAEAAEALRELPHD